MLLAKVFSRVVSSAKLESFPARPLLRIQLLSEFGEPEDDFIAIDSVQSGPGDTVLVLQEGTGARETVLSDPTQPLAAQWVIVGIVDDIQKA